MPQALTRTTHLCVGAHQDDEEFMAYHGIAECYGRKDKWFTGVCLTNGGGSARTDIYADYSDEEMMEVRQQEQRKAAYVGDYACQIQLGHPSSDLKNPAETSVIDELRKIFETARPEEVYLHNPADKHDTHVAAVLRSISALRALPKDQRPRKVYGCEIWRSLDWLNDDDKQVLPVDGHPNLAAALSGVFDSQIVGGKRYDSAVMGRRTANATFFESHATDKSTALSWAMDLTPLIEDDELSVAEHTQRFIDRFAQSVSEKIATFSS
jgi:LmbE family N-acetylglucosaminyl deacetylase